MTALNAKDLLVPVAQAAASHDYFAIRIPASASFVFHQSTYPIQLYDLGYRKYIIIIMKLLASALLIGGCYASPPMQQVLQAPHDTSESWLKPLQNLQDSLKSLTNEARAVWDEVALMYPHAMDQTSFFSLPKKHNRRPDSHWDHITKGADIQSVWVENENGEQEREIDGRLESFNLRTKKVDPASLGVDPGVKQYSGYLDDNENDKHLFYCE